MISCKYVRLPLCLLLNLWSPCGQLCKNNFNMMSKITLCYKTSLCTPEWLISESFNGVVIWKANGTNRGLCVKCDMIKSAVVENKLQSKVKHKDIKNSIDCAGFVGWLKSHLIQTSFIQALCAHHNLYVASLGMQHDISNHELHWFMNVLSEHPS